MSFPLLAFPDPAVSCAAVDQAVADALSAVDVPGVPNAQSIPLRANVSAVAPVPTAANVPSAIGVFKISPVPAVIGIPAVFLTSLLLLEFLHLLISQCCW